MTERVSTILPAELVAAAERVVQANRAAGRKIALAESCTGGLVCAALTEIAGSSDVFLAGFVTYADSAKRRQLGVKDDAIATFGAVSPAVARAMAQGAAERSGADVAVSITGIAGPGGGTATKPVGTVVFAKAQSGSGVETVATEEKRFPDNGRGGVRLQAALRALELLMPDAEPGAVDP